MKKAVRVILIVLGLIIAVIAYYKIYYPSFTYKYRMTVEVDTPEGVKSGSSVIEVHTTQWPEGWRNMFGGHTENSKAIGEAVVVDLGDKGMLFTASLGTYSERLYPLIFTKGGYGSRKPGGVPGYATAVDFKASIPVKHYPLLVRFKDLQDPMTVEEVKPNDLVSSFGEGFALKSISVESTTDPIKWKVEKILPWLPQYYDQLLDGRTIHTIEAENRLANDLGSGSFSVKTQ